MGLCLVPYGTFLFHCSPTPGNGYIFDCFPTDTHASENHLSSNIANLGRSGTSSMVTTLKGGNYQIYVFKNYTDYSAVFTKLGLPRAADNGAGGYTLPLTINGGYSYTVLFSQPTSTTTFTDPQMAENGAHEVGHALDYLRGWSTNSAGPDMDKYMQWDFLDLDYRNRDQTDPLKPCGGTDKLGHVYTGPLVGIQDPSTLSNFCTGTTLESKWGTRNATSILRDPSVDLGFWAFTPANKSIGQKTYPATGGWNEWYAQSFAIQVNGAVNGGGVAVIQDQVVANGYFQCTAGTTSSGTIEGYLRYIWNSQAPALPTKCTDPLFSWWTKLH